jgi:hypothetical protein
METRLGGRIAAVSRLGTSLATNRNDPVEQPGPHQVTMKYQKLTRLHLLPRMVRRHRRAHRYPFPVERSFGPNLTADRARSFSDSTSRLRGSAVVTNDRISALADAVTSSTARSNASSFALDGLVNPQIFLTNWSDASRISASVAGGSKLNSVLMFLHMAALVSPVGQGNLAVT